MSSSNSGLLNGIEHCLDSLQLYCKIRPLNAKSRSQQQNPCEENNNDKLFIDRRKLHQTLIEEQTQFYTLS